MKRDSSWRTRARSPKQQPRLCESRGCARTAAEDSLGGNAYFTAAEVICAERATASSGAATYVTQAFFRAEPEQPFRNCVGPVRMHRSPCWGGPGHKEPGFAFLGSCGRDGGGERTAFGSALALFRRPHPNARLIPIPILRRQLAGPRAG